MHMRGSMAAKSCIPIRGSMEASSGTQSSEPPSKGVHAYTNSFPPAKSCTPVGGLMLALLGANIAHSIAAPSGGTQHRYKLEEAFFARGGAARMAAISA